jgi:hypothetical protein
MHTGNQQPTRGPDTGRSPSEGFFRSLLGLAGLEIVIALGAIFEKPFPPQFWRWAVLLYLAVAPALLAVLWKAQH